MKSSISETSTPLTDSTFQDRKATHTQTYPFHQNQTLRDSEKPVHFLNPFAAAQRLLYILTAQVVFCVTLYASQGFCW